MGPFALALGCLAGGFSFSSVEAWKQTGGAETRIPALSAVLDNRTGKDWSEAQFTVTVACEAGGARSYDIRLRNIVPGRQAVRETAFDAIGVVEPCDGPARVEFIGGTGMPDQARPSFAVLGFSIEHDGGPPAADLEGILDYRRRADGRAVTRPVYWSEGGFSIALPEWPSLRWYVLRVAPGDLGLSGFLLNRDPQSTGPLQRFLRTYRIPPGEAALLGIFRLYRGTRAETGVRIESGAGALKALGEVVAERLARPLSAAPAQRPGPSTTLVRD
jgi:hypothetical protein